MSRPELSTGPTEELAALQTAHAATNGSAAASEDTAAVTGAVAGSTPAGATCAECGAPLAADQRYCLACGRPASPVRLAFLDVLQAEQPPGALGGQNASAAAAHVPAYYAPPEPDGLLGGLRRYSGLLALVGVLLVALLIGLLVGHWITGGGGGAAPAKQVVEVRGLGGALAAAPTGTAGSATPNTNSSSGSGSTRGATAKSAQAQAKEEVQDAKEVKAAKAPPPIHKKTTAQSLQKLGKSTGKQHSKEVNELIKGDEPIETGH